MMQHIPSRTVTHLKCHAYCLCLDCVAIFDEEGSETSYAFVMQLRM
jgi:hypothetical protein